MLAAAPATQDSWNSVSQRVITEPRIRSGS